MIIDDRVMPLLTRVRAVQHNYSKQIRAAPPDGIEMFPKRAVSTAKWIQRWSGFGGGLESATEWIEGRSGFSDVLE